MNATATAEFASASGPDVAALRLARVYAQAIVEAADKQGCRGEVLQELNDLVTDVLPRVPSIADVFGSPRIPLADKAALIQRSCGSRVSTPTLNTLLVLARHDRLAVLPEIVSAARRLVEKLEGKRQAEITTALPLDEPSQQSLLAAVQQALGQALAPTFSVDPGILGGLVVRIEDTVYDHSVATSLSRLGQRLKQRSIHEVQHRRDRLGSP